MDIFFSSTRETQQGASKETIYASIWKESDEDIGHQAQPNQGDL